MKTGMTTMSADCWRTEYEPFTFALDCTTVYVSGGTGHGAGGHQ